MGMRITGLNKYSARLRSEAKRMQTDGEKIAKDAAEYGADLMREFIRTRGTGYKGHTGRIETGAMLEAVQVGQPTRTKNGIAISFGWGVAGGSREDYFYFQEAYPTPGGHPPMHALLDALVRSREYFYARIKEVV